MDNTIYVLDNTQILLLYKNVKCIYVTVGIFFFGRVREKVGVYIDIYVYKKKTHLEKQRPKC